MTFFLKFIRNYRVETCIALFAAIAFLVLFDFIKISPYVFRKPVTEITITALPKRSEERRVGKEC